MFQSIIESNQIIFIISLTLTLSGKVHICVFLYESLYRGLNYFSWRLWFHELLWSSISDLSWVSAPSQTWCLSWWCVSILHIFYMRRPESRIILRTFCYFQLSLWSPKRADGIESRIIWRTFCPEIKRRPPWYTQA